MPTRGRPHRRVAIVAITGERNVVPEAPAGTLYRGREGMWSWVAQRVSGFLVFFFLFAHVLDTALVRVSPESYNTVIDTYKNPIVGIGETGLVAAVLFHAFNGVRVMLVDFWSQGPRYQRQLLWGVLALWVLLFAPFAVRHLTNVLG
jgi:succinate dehydrogenase / fumarate reductase, cytochrome b subunit